MDTTYKMVLEDPSGGLWSPLSGVYRYYRNRWLQSPIGGFLCYEVLEAAQMSWLPHATIWECRADGQIDLPVRITNFGVVAEPDVVEAAWDPKLHDELENDLLYKNPRMWEPGTVAYQRLMPVKRVFPDTAVLPKIADLYTKFDQNPELYAPDLTMSLSFTLLDEVVNNTVASYLAGDRHKLAKTIDHLVGKMVRGMKQWRKLRKDIITGGVGGDENVVQLVPNRS